MRPKYKVTGCARFFIFLIIFVPVVFFGAAYLRGENGMQALKDYYHQIVGQPKQEKSGETYSVEQLQKELESARDEIRSLKKDLEAKDAEIERLKSGQSTQ